MITITVATILSLFLYDIDLAWCPKAFDDVVVVIVSICMAIFSLEFALNVYAKPDYVGSFFMLIDIVGTVSLIPDIIEVGSNWLGGGTGGALQVSVAGRVGRVARTAGSLRFTRFVRLFRVVRLIRVARLFKLMQAIPVTHHNDDLPTPSKLGVLLSDTVCTRSLLEVISPLF